MPRFKSKTFQVEKGAGEKLTLCVPINIDADGLFYCNLGNEFRAAFASEESSNSRTPEGHIRLESATFDGLCDVIRLGLDRHLKPRVTETHVIRFNIESHACFAEGAEGQVYPNAGYKGASWKDDQRTHFGSHHSGNPARGGCG